MVQVDCFCDSSATSDTVIIVVVRYANHNMYMNELRYGLTALVSVNVMKLARRLTICARCSVICRLGETGGGRRR